MKTFKMDLVADGNDPFTGKPFPVQKETLLIVADSLNDARKLVPVYMTLKIRGQSLRIFNNGTELFGNF